MPPRSFKRDALLTLGALGVVFGDIGTSPLYAMRETVLATGGSVPRTLAIYGRAVADLLGARSSS